MSANPEYCNAWHSCLVEDQLPVMRTVRLYHDDDDLWIYQQTKGREDGRHACLPDWNCCELVYFEQMACCYKNQLVFLYVRFTRQTVVQIF